MGPSIAVIMPTLGRPTLRRAVASVLPQLGEKDELLVVGDGPQPRAHWVKDYFKLRYFEHGPTRSWGAAQYDFGMEMAETDWVMFLPDDDVLAPGAVEAVRKAVEGTNGVHVFACKMNHWGGKILRGSKKVCEVTANQLVLPAPNSRKGLVEQVVTPQRMPRWADSKEQTFDHIYLTAILGWYDQLDPHYHDEIICLADQQNNGRVF